MDKMISILLKDNNSECDFKTGEFFSQAFFLNFYQQKSNLNVNYSYIMFQKEILKSFCHLACVLWVCILKLF